MTMRKTKWQQRKVVAWDGEGANLDSGEHIYNLLANSEGDLILNPDGLTTEETLDFFIDHSIKNAINVVFGGSYDVNMFLRDVPPDRLSSLWINGHCYYKNYKIFYTPRKRFSVYRYYGIQPKAYDSFVLWDVLGYFQCSFVNACRKWLGDASLLDDIEQMKYQRSEFTTEKLEQIIAYNRNECQLLVQLMQALFVALDTADIKLKRYDGAGSIAAALLQKHGVAKHKGEPSEEVKRWAQYAYSGGRIEPPKIGNFDGRVYRYDINSAYPSAARSLPSYKGAAWSLSDVWDGTDNSMVHVRWHYSGDRSFYPLWYREHDGSILYPKWGEGIYWGAEVKEALQSFPNDIEVLGAINCTLANDDKPFEFIDDIYRLRQRFKREGNMASEALKLGLNSLYGKLAQQMGWRNDRPPTYHQLLWAGQITAKCRATLYEAAMQKPEAIIAFATDAVISLEPLDLPCSTNLGEWEADVFDGITLVQAGVYWLNDNGDWHDKYRGFDKGALDREHIINCWRMGYDSYVATLTRFITLGSALSSTDFYRKWRTWDSQPRILSIVPGGKRSASEDTLYWEKLCDTVPKENMSKDAMSKPYPLLWIEGSEGVAQNRPLTSGIDMRVVEEEYLDSYA